MSNPETAKDNSQLQTPNTQRSTVVRRADLPLHCPPKGSSLWNSHPRVFIPIEDADDGQMICPYCGTEYTLKD